MTKPAQPTAGEREAAERKLIERAFDVVCPGVIGNRFIPHWPTRKQQAFLGLHLHARTDRVFEALFGGSVGGGKSDALLMAAAQYVSEPHFAALVLRRTFQDLALPGAIMDRAIEWWRPIPGVHWNGERKTFTFPSGATVTFGYLAHEHDHLQYQGAEVQMIAWDELTQFPMESQYRYLALSRVRRTKGVSDRIPLRSLAASNPGGPGHDWVRARFVGDPSAGIVAPHIYLPSMLIDNPHLDAEAYVDALRDLHPTVRDQLLKGDWGARDPGDYFRAEWFGPLLDPETDRWANENCVRIRWWDLAASEREDAARTAGVLMARHRFGVRAVEDCRAFRATPGRRDDLIVQTAQADGRAVIVGIEIEPGSGGQAQFDELARRLGALGFRVVGARPRVGGSDLSDREKAYLVTRPKTDAGKAGRADPVASCLERGYQRRGEGKNLGSAWWGVDAAMPVQEQRDGIRLFAGPWTRDYLNELEAFPTDDVPCDRVDATSGAYAWLESHPFGAGMPPSMREQKRPGHEAHDVHPELRARDEEVGLTDRGRWQP